MSNQFKFILLFVGFALAEALLFYILKNEDRSEMDIYTYYIFKSAPILIIIFLAFAIVGLLIDWQV